MMKVISMLCLVSSLTIAVAPLPYVSRPEIYQEWEEPHAVVYRWMAIVCHMEGWLHILGEALQLEGVTPH